MNGIFSTYRRNLPTLIHAKFSSNDATTEIEIYIITATVVVVIMTSLFSRCMHKCAHICAARHVYHTTHRHTRTTCYRGVEARKFFSLCSKALTTNENAHIHKCATLSSGGSKAIKRLGTLQRRSVLLKPCNLFLSTFGKKVHLTVCHKYQVLRIFIEIFFLLRESDKLVAERKKNEK